jgi:hypothetical protein
VTRVTVRASDCWCGHSLDHHTWTLEGSDEEFVGMCGWLQEDDLDEGCHCSDYVPLTARRES